MFVLSFFYDDVLYLLNQFVSEQSHWQEQSTGNFVNGVPLLRSYLLPLFSRQGLSLPLDGEVRRLLQTEPESLAPCEKHRVRGRAKQRRARLGG